ncbi:MAG: hypothetical protein QOJ98_1560, partial [Acidobacteriota bacterium]|nr:hypothetical protein [Acidobacteriota bacterium]
MITAVPLLVLATVLTGNLCVERDCRTVQLQPAPEVIHLPPADRSRNFTMISRDGSEVVLGQVAAGASQLTLDRALGGTAVVRALSRHDEAIPPIRARIASRDGVRAWDVTLTPTAGRHELTLYLPAGSYNVTLATSNGRMKPSEEVAVEVAAGKKIDVPSWNWVRQLRGTVRAADLKYAIPDAAIVDPKGDLLTVTDAEGRFVIDELEPQNQPQIGVRAPGFGARWIPLPYEEPELGVVELFRGSTLTLYVDHPTATQPLPLQIQVREDSSDATRPIVERRGHTAERIEITDLPPGKLRLFISGPEPLQHYSRPLEVAADLELRVSIEPVQARGVVTYGNDVLPRATVEVQGDGRWRGTVTTDSQGAFETEMWDKGDLLLNVTAAPLSAPYVTMQRGQSLTPRYLDIQIPATVLRGRVYGDGKGLSAAKIRIRSIFSEVEYSRSAKTTDTGEFEITGVPAGKHELSAAAQGYLESRIEVSTEATDDVHEVKIDLKRGYDVDVAVQTADGRAVPGALVAVGIGPDRVRPERTVFAAEDGHAYLTLEPSAVKSVFVLDSFGRFTHAIVSADRAGKEERVSIPDAEGVLVLRTVD